MKTLKWIASSKADLMKFPALVRREAGYELWKVQNDEEPTDSEPMPDVGRGVFEIRINIGDAFRVFYVAKFEDSVYVLHVFQKKTRKTSKRDIELGRDRYKTLTQQLRKK